MTASEYFKIESLGRASVIELWLTPALDMQAFNEISEALIDRWSIARGRNVIVDLAHVQFHGSIVLGLLINIRTRTRAGGGEMIVVGASPELVHVCRTANLDRLIVMVGTRQQALARW